MLRLPSYLALALGPLILAGCDRAIRELGRRLESCLGGTRTAKDFSAAVSGMPESLSEGIYPEQGKSRLYSCGPVPQLLDDDGLVTLREHPDGAPIALSGKAAKHDPSLLAKLEAKHPGRVFRAPSFDGYIIDDGEPAFQVRFGYYAQTGPDDPAYAKETSP